MRNQKKGPSETGLKAGSLSYTSEFRPSWTVRQNVSQEDPFLRREGHVAKESGPSMRARRC